MVTPTKASSRTSFIFKTPLPTNDDEDERRRSRSVSSSASSVNVSVLEENEELKVCLQQFIDNKINKDNAWQTNLIDTLANLVSGHRKYVKNFQVVGASLEASSKIYGYRVDMVHNEVMRMSGGLTRMNVGGKNDGEENSDNLDNSHSGDPINDSGNDLEQRQAKAKAKAKKRRQQSSTVTKCKASINGKLDTVPFLDPVFADIKSNLGDMNSSNRAFLNTLESNNSELLFDYDNPYWDNSPNDFILKEDESPVENEKFYFMKYKKLTGPVKIRTIFRDYHISDKPCDMNKILQSTVGDNVNINDSESENELSPDDHFTQENFDDPGICGNGSTLPRMTFAFDANAEIESVQDTRISCPIELDDNQFSAEEIVALNTVAGAKRTKILIDTLQPCDASHRKLEYSYRPLTEITKFWAGPSYWKIRPSVPPRGDSQIQTKRTSTSIKVTRNTAASKKKLKNKPISLEIVEPDQSLYKTFDPNRKPKNIMKNWDPKKLKLPVNHHIDVDYFDKMSYAQGVKIRNSVVISNMIDLEEKKDGDELENAIPDDMDNIDDVCGGDTDFQNDILCDNTNLNENLNLSNLMSQNHLGPQKIEKIIIPYATKAKIINMKQLKLSCSKVVNEPSSEQLGRELTDIDIKYLKKVSRHLKNNNENYDKGYATFSELYSSLPLHLSDVLKENLSVPIAFSAILHLANERNFRFVPTDDNQNDFKIIKVLEK